MSKFRQWGKITPLDPDKAPYDPQTVLHHVATNHPKAKALVVVGLDHDNESILKISDMNTETLTWLARVLQIATDRRVWP